MNNFPNFNFNIFNSKPAAPPAGLVNTPENSPVSQEAFKPMFQTPKEQIQKEPTVNSMMYDFEMVKMDSETVLKYLQSAMKMPENLEKFVQNANIGTLRFFVENLINTKLLAEFINQNSTLAIEKIVKAMSESLKAGIKDVSQLKEILGILTSIQTSTNLSQNALKELLLLYIPLNPMVFDKPIDFSPQSSDIEDSINNSALSIIFETINFSNILCCINCFENNLYIDLYIDKIFPYDKFTKILNSVAKEANLNITVEAKYSRKINSKEPAKAQNIKIFSQGTVQIEVLILASIIIKTIFKTDDDFSRE